MTNPDADPYDEWLDQMVGQYRASMRDPQVVGDDDTGYLVNVEAASPREMADGFESAVSPEVWPLLLAYAVRRCTLLQLDIDHLKKKEEEKNDSLD